MERTSSKKAPHITHTLWNDSNLATIAAEDYFNLGYRDSKDHKATGSFVGLFVGLVTVHFVDFLIRTGPLPPTFPDFRHAARLSMFFAPSMPSQAAGLAMDISTFDLPYSRKSRM